MKQKLFTLLCLLFLFAIKSSAQTTIWTETFDGTDSTYFSSTLNTLDNGCAGPTAYNLWVINKDYAGGTGTGSVYCQFLGSNTPDDLSEAGTAAEPAGISNQNGYYLHIVDPSGFTATPTPLACADFIYADGLCVPAQNSFCKMNAGVNTTGHTSLNLDFWWLCKGGANHYANIFYSIDGGNTWVQLTTAPNNYSGQANWTQQTIPLPAPAIGVTDLRLGFMWVNMVNTSELDPSFSVDDISIVDPGVAAGTITTTPGSYSSPYCNATSNNVSVAFTTTGTVTGTDTVYLSNTTGSFNPGTIIGMGTTSPISATIPAITAAGTGYRIEVKNGAATPTNNGSNLTITAATEATVTIATPKTTVCSGSGATFTATPGTGITSPSYQWKVNGNSVNGATSFSYTPGTINNGDVFTCVLTTASGCFTGYPVTSNPITMTVNGSIDAGTITTVKDTLCASSVAHLTVSGYTPGSTLQWQSSTNDITFSNIGGATNPTYSSNPLTQNTYYEVVVTNGGCTGNTPSFEVSTIPAPLASFTETIVGKVATFTNTSTGATSYVWSFGDGTTSNVINPVHTYPNDSSYDACLTADNSSSCTYQVCNLVYTGVSNITTSSNWNIYPDPVTNQLFISTDNITSLSIQNIQVYDVLGRLAFTKELNGARQNPLQVDMSGLKAGVYYLKINTPEGSYVKSLIKQ